MGITFIALFFLLNSVSQSSANDMPLAGMPANGLVIRDEKNIQIEKEELYISHTKIEVSYIFRNYSDHDIVTEVAFPIPPYNDDTSGNITYPLHGDFKVAVNGKEVKHHEITKALLNNKDCTALLKRMGISIKSFQFPSMTNKQRKKLLNLGLITLVEESESVDATNYSAAWTVKTTYYWKQAFPARATVSIRHTYTPNASHTYLVDDYKYFVSTSNKPIPGKSEWADLLCLDNDLSSWLKRKEWGEIYIVDYILTTANHWKKPIKEFRLILESFFVGSTIDQRISTCFERKRLKKINDKRYELTIKDFVPNEEIRVFFLN